MGVTKSQTGQSGFHFTSLSERESKREQSGSGFWGRGLESGIRVWVGAEAGQVVWGPDPVQDAEPVPEARLESRRLVNDGRTRVVFEKGLGETPYLGHQGLDMSRGRV